MVTGKIRRIYLHILIIMERRIGYVGEVQCCSDAKPLIEGEDAERESLVHMVCTYVDVSFPKDCES